MITYKIKVLEFNSDEWQDWDTYIYNKDFPIIYNEESAKNVVEYLGNRYKTNKLSFGYVPVPSESKPIDSEGEDILLEDINEFLGTVSEDNIMTKQIFLSCSMSKHMDDSELAYNNQKQMICNISSAINELGYISYNPMMNAPTNKKEYDDYNCETVVKLNRDAINKSDYFISIVDDKSGIGQGVEAIIAENKGLPILILSRENVVVSDMIRGLKNVKHRILSKCDWNINGICESINEWLNK